MSDVFTPDQVVTLMKHQLEGHMHPYTCGNRGSKRHREILGDRGVLIPTTKGWICPFCDYTQDWAHGITKPE
jgi:hypothetical protein